MDFLRIRVWGKQKHQVQRLNRHKFDIHTYSAEAILLYIICFKCWGEKMFCMWGIYLWLGMNHSPSMEELVPKHPVKMWVLFVVSKVMWNHPRHWNELIIKPICLKPAFVEICFFFLWIHCPSLYMHLWDNLAQVVLIVSRPRDLLLFVQKYDILFGIMQGM